MPTGPTEAERIDRVDAADTGISRTARYDRRKSSDPTVSVILPTYNEATNLPILLDRLIERMADLDYEIIVVDDDSPDRTWEIADHYSEQHNRVQTIRRLTDRGLSSAVMTGMGVARGRVLAVMDSDLQHDEDALLDVIAPVLDGDADVSLGSREADGGSYGEWSKWRRTVSWGGAQLARQTLGISVSDPMSGFFAISRDRYEAVADQVNPRGFKILLEFLARGDRPTVVEVGYEFRDRVHGATKLTGSVVGSYLVALIDLFVGRIVSATFTAYALVGILGVAVRFTALLALSASGFTAAAIVAFELSVVSNYMFNNTFTFARARRRGSRALTGFVPFQLIAFHGLMVQAGIASVAGIGFDELWAAPIWLQLVGIGVATTGNFHLNRAITWRN